MTHVMYVEQGLRLVYYAKHRRLRFAVLSHIDAIHRSLL
jgi:hypothetical protein